MLRVRCGGQQFEIKFLVVPDESCIGKPPLLSGSPCELLGLTQIFADEVHRVSTFQSQLTVEQIHDQYADVFRGLGSIGSPLHIDVDPEVVATQVYPRRIAVSKKENVKAKLDEMVKKDILVPVTEPTKWSSNSVVVEKLNKIRICLDPQDLNRAVQRSVYPIPTVEEILPSIFDALDGFTQICLDDESSFLTTMQTLFGHYRWLCMPYGLSSAPEEYH